MKKGLKYIKYLVIGIILILIIGMVLLQLPAVQTKIVNQINQGLSEKLGNQMSIDNVSIDYLNYVDLEGIYIEDLAGDTLALVDHLAVKVSLWGLIKNELLITEATLKGADIRLQREDLNKAYNFQFLIDAFTPKNDQNKDTRLAFDIDELQLLQTHFELVNGSDLLEFDLQKAGIEISHLDINSKKISVSDLALSDADVSYLFDSKTSDTPKTLKFPSSAWEIDIANINTKHINLQYKENITHLKTDRIAFNNLAFEDINLEAKFLHLDNTLVSGQIDKLSLDEQSGFSLTNLTTAFSLNEKGINIPTLQAQTPMSTLNNITHLSFNQFSDLKNPKSLQISSIFDKTKINIRDARYFSQALSKKFFANINESEHIILDGKLEGNTESLRMDKLVARIPGIINTTINGTASDILDKETFSFDIQFKELKTSSTKLGKILSPGTLPIALDAFGNVDIQGAFKGSLNKFDVRNLEFKSEASTSAKLSGTVNDILDKEKLLLDLQIEQLNTHLEDIKGFIKGELPPAIKNAGAISYTGAYTGTLKDFDLDGKLNTDIGSAETDVQLTFDNSYTGASYSGEIQLQDFDLGAVLNNEDFGTISLSIDADGEGLNIASMNSQMKMNVAKLVYRDVTYENFTFNGIVDQKKINGDFSINNPNAVAEFHGLLDLNGEQPEMNFILDIDTLSLREMNLSNQDISLSGKMDIKGRGNTIDDFIGNVQMESFNLRKDTLTYHTDKLSISADQISSDYKEFYFDTDGIDASIKGDFNISQIPIYAKDIVDEYIPIQWLASQENKMDRELRTKEIFDANLKIESEDFLHLFLPKLEKFEDLDLQARVNSEQDSLLINGTLKNIQYDRFTTHNLKLFATNRENSIVNTLSFEDFNGIGNFEFPRNTIKTVLQKDKLTVDVGVQNDSLQNLLAFGGDLTNVDKIYEFKFDEKLQLDSTIWTIKKQNNIQFKKDYLYVDQLEISKDQQSLSLQSEKSKILGDTPLKVLVDNFNIHELTNLMALENDFLYGTANADLVIQDIFTDPNYAGDISAKELILNQTELGEIRLEASKRTNSSILDIELSLDGKQNYLEGSGTFDVASKAVDFKTTFDSLNIATIEPYIENIISNSQGTVAGTLRIGGTTDKPIINGKVNTNSLATTVNFSQARYKLNNQTIFIEDSKFALDNLLLTDEEGRQARISGAIKHQDFKDFNYDLDINTEAFQILNTTKEDNPLFYGNLILEAQAKVIGPLKLPQLSVEANSLKGTKFHLSPFVESDAVSQDNYIIFIDSQEVNDSLQSIIYELTNNLPLDLELNLSVDKETEFQFILDPNTGDKLTCFGDANLQVKVEPDGQINVFGTYLIDNGKYEFSYAKVINKEFAINKGGSVTFQGDPLLAQINVEAAYNTKATPIAILDGNTGLSDAETNVLQKRSGVQVSLNIDGTINNPDLGFDLKFLDNDIQNNATIERKLADIRADEQELYNQVFGLILFNTFISTSGPTISLNTGSNIALKSVTGLVESRLNQLASNYIKGIDLIVNVDSYNSTFIDETQNTSVTEFGLGASKSFFNDRLTFQALGNIDVDNRTKGAAFSSIAGDFIIEYKLNSKGNITLEAFRKSDFDVLLEENTIKNGISISAQKALHLRNKKSQK